MKHVLSKITLFSFLFYILSLILAKVDFDFSLRWVTFAFWIISVLLLPLSLFLEKLVFLKKNKIGFRNPKINLLPFFLITLLATGISFVFLIKYPFVAIYDQIRDGGLNGQEIANGSLKNIFGYGRYESHGLIIPTITSFFNRLFPHSVLTYRFPAALIAIWDVILIYLAVDKHFRKKAGFWAGLTLLNLPLHLYYGRTEIVVIFSSFFTSAFLFLLGYWGQNKSLKTYSLLGLLAGFASGFHTSARTVSLLTVFLVASFSFFAIFFSQNRLHFFQGLILMLLFWLIGFGPRIWFTTPEIFFQTRSLDFQKEPSLQTPFLNQITELGRKYLQSFLVYFKESTFSTHYPDFKPILDPFLGFFFLLGLFFALFLSRNFFLKITSLYALILPLTNSAITEAVNSDNRLLPLLPISAVLVTHGAILVFSKIRSFLRSLKPIPIFLSLFFGFYLLFKGFNFFFQESATKQYTLLDYLSMHAIYILKSDKDYQKPPRICLNVSPANFPYFNLAHVQEQYQFFIPNKYFLIFPDENVLNNEFYLSSECSPKAKKDLAKFARYQFCEKPQRFICPKEGTFAIFLEKPFFEKEKNLFLAPSYILIPPTPQFLP